MKVNQSQSRLQRIIQQTPLYSQAAKTRSVLRVVSLITLGFVEMHRKRTRNASWQRTEGGMMLVGLETTLPTSVAILLSLLHSHLLFSFYFMFQLHQAGPRKSAFRTAPPQVFKEPEEDDSNSPNHHSDSTRKSRRLSDRATDVISSLGSTIGGFLGSNRSSNDSQSTSGSGSNNTISILPSARGQGERSLPPGIKRSLSEGQLEGLQEEEGEDNKEKERELVKRPRKSVAFKQKNRET